MQDGSYIGADREGAAVDGTYSGADREGAQVSLTLQGLGDSYSGALCVGDRELLLSLTLEGDELVGAAHLPGEGESYLVRASLFCGQLHLDLLGEVLRLERDGG